jgi:cytochrome c oxidase assembly protein subunit 15
MSTARFPADPATWPAAPWRYRFAVLTAGATLALIFIGGLVTSTGSGLSVPDWPLSYGMLMPPMVGGVLYEHGHRLAATAVGMLTLILAIWTARAETRRGVRRLAWAALGIIIAQGLLGGLTVLLLLPNAVSVAHGTLAQTFFCVVITLAYVLSSEFAAPEVTTDGSGVRASALVAAVLVYVQLILGAIMRHMGAGLAIPDFPLAMGRLIPPLESSHVVIHFAHRVWALAVLVGVFVMWLRCRRQGGGRLRVLPALVLTLALTQVFLGGLTVLSGRSVLPTTLHVANGAAILGGCWLTALRARRLLLPDAALRPTAGAATR